MYNKNRPIGSGAYFVGRKDLLKWVNNILDMNYLKVEGLCTGAAFCQIFDIIFPGSIPLTKVNFFAKYDYEYIKNYKLLQNCFNKNGVGKKIEVNRLVKGKYQDNLEFLQWVKRFFDENYKGGKYNAKQKRDQSRNRGGKKRILNSSSGNAVPSTKRGKSYGNSSQPKNVSSTKIQDENPGIENYNGDNSQKQKLRVKVENGFASINHKEIPEYMKYKIAEMSHQISEMQMAIDSLEKERDFYFGKLRDIELLCQNSDQNENIALSKVTKILYATNDDFTHSDFEDDDENIVKMSDEEKSEF